ncbi:MAG: hypothetical protein RIT02_3496, partial [Planctomycetota bacterium]
MRKALLSILTAVAAVCLVDSVDAGDRIVLRRPVFTGPVVAGPAWPG